MKCPRSYADEHLAAYWVGDLEDDEAARIDEHLLSCTKCFETVHAFAGIGASIRMAIAMERFPTAITPEQLADLQRRAHFVVEPVEAGGTCTRSMSDVDGIVYRLSAPLADAESVDLEISFPSGSRIALLEAVPFDPGGVVLCACARQTAQVISKSVLRLIAVRGEQRRIAAEYQLTHTA